LTRPIDPGAVSGRIPAVGGGVLVVLVVLALRVFQLAVVDRDTLAGLAQRQHREVVRITGLRGAIRDREGELLAETIAAPSIFASPRQFPVPREVRPALARILELPPRSLDHRLDSGAGFVWLKRRASQDQARDVAKLVLPGVGSVNEGRRIYPQGQIAAHVVGIAGVDLQGLEGIELLYDRWMRAPDVVYHVDRDGLGRALFTRGMSEGEAPPPVEPDPAEPVAAGAELALTLDAGLQAIVERELALGVKNAQADAGIAVVLDPKSGAILAMANVPTYDPNRPGDAMADARRNRAVTDAYEPGSTFKTFLAAAALEERAVKPEDKIFCENGHYRIGRWTIHDHHPYGLLSFPEVIQYSSNIGVSKVAERLGRERYARYLDAFGFGRRTAVDLPAEATGVIRPVKTWAQVDLATGSFGQGLSVTPIQLAAAYGAIANGGRLLRPHLLTRAQDQGGRPLLERDDSDRDAGSSAVISPATARSVTSMLERVVEVEGGTGKNARIDGIRVAGKTGTAQKVDPHTGKYSKQRLSSFIGFAPAEDPAYVTLVMIDNPRGQTYGGMVAAPVFREIMSRALDLAGISRGAAPTVTLASSSSAVRLRAAPIDGRAQVPSFLGMSLRRALAAAKADGLAVDARGSGFVRQQDPPPGAPRRAQAAVVLTLEPTA
jgi:cell division protein FtsI (penicillin-binding protein 3)